SFWTLAKRAAAATGNCAGSFKRASTNVPLPCISRFATNAFQYGTLPHAPEVCRLTPARPNAGGMSTAPVAPLGVEAPPSSGSCASKRPGPQLASTARTVASSTPSRFATGDRSGASPITAPTFRSRFGQPSRRRPMPGAKESSTVEWQRAHWMPTDVIWPLWSKRPVTPTTASSWSSASVVAGSLTSSSPRRSCLRRPRGSASTSALRPTPSATAGLTPGPTPPCCAPGDCLVQAERTTPEVLVTEGVEAEDLPSVVDELAGVGVDDVVEAATHRRGRADAVPLIGAHGPGRPSQSDQSRRECYGGGREGAHHTRPRHAAAPTGPVVEEPWPERAARSCASVRRTSAKAAIAISTSRTATSKKWPVRTRLPAIASSQTIATRAPSRGQRVRNVAPTAISTIP